VLSGRNELAQVSVAKERQVGGEQQQPGLGDGCQAGPKRGHWSGTGGPLNGELDARIAGKRGGQIRPGRTDDDEMTGARARRGCCDRGQERPAANFDRWLVRAAEAAGAAAREDDRGQSRFMARQVSRRLPTSAERAGGSQDR
jgi:hypothetical protein